MSYIPLPASKSISNFVYRRDIDGLRAIAVLAVVIFHLDASFIPGGFLGVDVFFVISGFLITSTLTRDLNRGDFSIFRFWERRLRRLFPAFATVLCLSMLAGGLFFAGDEWRDLSYQGISSITSTANIYMWQEANNYWGLSAESMVFLHMWSLSVEEQFYLFYPIVLFLLWKYLNRKKIPIFIILTCAFLIATYVVSFRFPAATFYFLPTRMWQLLMGCSLVWIIDLIPSKFMRLKLDFLGVLLIFASYFIFPKESDFAFFNAFGACLGAVFIIAFSRPGRGFVGKLLSWHPFVFVGKISYSLYLWHWPYIVFFHLMGGGNSLLIFCVSILSATISYYFVECNTRYLSSKSFRFVTLGLLVISIVSILLPFVVKRTFIEFDKPKFISGINLRPRLGGAMIDGYSGDYKSGLVLSDLTLTGNKVDVLVLGDSHSLSFYPPIRKACGFLNLSLCYYGADGGASPFFVETNNVRDHYSSGWSDCERIEFDFYRKEFIEKYTPRIIIVCSRWETFWEDHELEEIHQYLENLVDHSYESDWVFIGQPPVLPFGKKGFGSDGLDLPLFRQFEEKRNKREARTSMNELLKSMASLTENVHFISIESIFTGDSGIRFREGKKMYYHDDDHLSVSGSLLCSDLILEKLSELQYAVD